MKSPLVLIVSVIVAAVSAILFIPVKAKKSPTAETKEPKISTEEGIRRADERRARRKEAKRAEEEAQEAERRKFDPEHMRRFFDANPDLPTDIRQTIRAKKIQIGMTEEMVEAAWGRPERKNDTITSNASRSQWVYGETYVYFLNGKMTSYQTSR